MSSVRSCVRPLLFVLDSCSPMLKRILKILVLLLIVGKLIRPARCRACGPGSRSDQVTKPSAEVKHLCVFPYDCHSGQPRYPWYMNITRELAAARAHRRGPRAFDASAWGAVTPKRRAHWAEEATEMVEEGRCH